MVGQWGGRREHALVPPPAASSTTRPTAYAHTSTCLPVRYEQKDVELAAALRHQLDGLVDGGREGGGPRQPDVRRDGAVHGLRARGSTGGSCSVQGGARRPCCLRPTNARTCTSSSPRQGSSLGLKANTRLSLVLPANAARCGCWSAADPDGRCAAQRPACRHRPPWSLTVAKAVAARRKHRTHQGSVGPAVLLLQHLLHALRAPLDAHQGMRPSSSKADSVRPMMVMTSSYGLSTWSRSAPQGRRSHPPSPPSARPRPSAPSTHAHTSGVMACSDLP